MYEGMPSRKVVAFSTSDTLLGDQTFRGGEKPFSDTHWFSLHFICSPYFVTFVNTFANAVSRNY